MNCSSVQSPRPVSLSGVRLAVKLTPHGPAHAVIVDAATIPHGQTGTAGGVGSFRPAGCPESRPEKSSSRPFGPIFQGVWQSLHPIAHTRYSPRATVAAWASLEVGWLAPTLAVARIPVKTTATRMIRALVAISLGLIIGVSDSMRRLRHGLE